MKLSNSVRFSALLLLPLSGAFAAPKLFPPLRNATPIAVFASKAKAVVTDQGDVEQFIYKPESDPGRRRNGPRLRIGIMGYPLENVAITQRYTKDATPVVKTEYRWPGLQMSLRVFAAEPEASGFFVIGEVSGAALTGKKLAVDLCLDNLSGGGLLEQSKILDDQGRLLLRMLPAETEPAARLGLDFPDALVARQTPCYGVSSQIPISSKPSGKFPFALQLPVDDRTSWPFPETASAAQKLQTTNAKWQDLLDGSMTIEIPDTRLQDAWNANLKQLGMFLEPQPDGLRILKGLDHYYGSNPYDTLQGSLILDRLGFHDLAEATLRRQLKRVQPDGAFQVWEQPIPPARPPVFWIVQGLAPFAIWKHYEITQDRRWLEEAWPVVLRSLKATMKARSKSSSNGTQGGIAIQGFLPPDAGDGGIPVGYSLPGNFGALTGYWVAIQMATALAAPEKEWILPAYESYKKNILDVMRASAVPVGNRKIIPSFPGANFKEAAKHLWGTVEGVYPFAQLAPDDPLILPTLRFLQENKSNGLHLNLGYSAGVWPYLSAAVGHWHLRLGEFDEAFRIQQAILDHASPTWGWYEECEAQPPKGYAGIPDVWQTSELLHLTRELLLLEKDDALLIAPAIPESWMKAGNAMAVKHAPSPLADVSYHIGWKIGSAAATVNLSGAKRVNRIRIRLMPEHVKAKIAVTGATLDSIDGGFIQLSNLSENVKVDAQW